jgi:hypothetical protein
LWVNQAFKGFMGAKQGYASSGRTGRTVVKRTLAGIVVGVVLGSLLTGLVAMASALAAGTTGTATSQAQPATAATAPAPVVVVVAAPESAMVEEDRAPHAEGSDPVLGGRHWGTRSDKVKGARGHAVTSDLHSNVENYESTLLTSQQSSELLDIFHDSRGVRRLVRSYGGDPDKTKYWVKDVNANEDRAGKDTPWVTAILRADFASPEGKRGIEMQVYRKKISSARLDNTPYVAWTQVSYVEASGELSRDGGYHPPGDTGVSVDGLDTIRFKN